MARCQGGRHRRRLPHGQAEDRALTKSPDTLVLGLDTSGDAGSVALLDTGENGFAIESVFEKGLIHGVALAPSVEALLREAGRKPADLALVAVGTGPGSWTGVRVGVAFAKSLAFAADIPVIGVPSLDAIAFAAPRDRDVACVRDARRETLYVGIYRNGVRDGDLRLVPLDRAAEELPAGALLLGDAGERFGSILSGDGRELGDRDRSRSGALAVARLGLEAFRRRGPDDVHDLSPVYLRLSEAEERIEGKDPN